MGYVVHTPPQMFYHFLLFLMFSLIFMNLQSRKFVYHAIEEMCNVLTFNW